MKAFKVCTHLKNFYVDQISHFFVMKDETVLPKLAIGLVGLLRKSNLGASKTTHEERWTGASMQFGSRCNVLVLFCAIFSLLNKKFWPVLIERYTCKNIVFVALVNL